MKMTSKLGLKWAVPAAAILLLPLAPAMAETLTGTLNGHSCAHAGTSCPADRLDPHITLEPDFVLQKADGEYYFLPNVRRDTKVRYVLQRYNSMVVDELKVKRNGEWVTVWSPELERNSWQEIQTRTNR
jgi:hypothetical protein